MLAIDGHLLQPSAPAMRLSVRSGCLCIAWTTSSARGMDGSEVIDTQAAGGPTKRRFRLEIIVVKVKSARHFSIVRKVREKVMRTNLSL